MVKLLPKCQPSVRTAAPWARYHASVLGWSLIRVYEYFSTTHCILNQNYKYKLHPSHWITVLPMCVWSFTGMNSGSRYVCICNIQEHKTFFFLKSLPVSTHNAIVVSISKLTGRQVRETSSGATSERCIDKLSRFLVVLRISQLA